jgi:hypothetical protein
LEQRFFFAREGRKCLIFHLFNTAKSFQKEFEKYLEGYSLVQYTRGLTTVCLLEDSLSLLFELAKTTFNRNTSYIIHIAELTPNVIGFKSNNAKFVRDMSQKTEIAYLGVSIRFAKFNSESTSGWSRYKRPISARINSLISDTAAISP